MNKPFLFIAAMFPWIVWLQKKQPRILNRGRVGKHLPAAGCPSRPVVPELDDACDAVLSINQPQVT